MKVNIKKNFTSFFRSGNSVSRVIETNIPQGYINHLPFYEGMYTVKLGDHPDTKINPGKPVANDFFITNLYKGYVHVDGNELHLISKKKKMVKTITRSYYHALADDLAEIVNIIHLAPDVEIIINISDVQGLLDNPEWDLLKYFFNCLDKSKVKYTIVDFSKFDVVYIDNFSILTFPFHSGARLDLLSEFLQKFVSGSIMKTANRKVFVSRKHTHSPDFKPEAANFSYINDKRIDDAQRLEDLFASLGYEIIYAESISTFEEQIRFFSSVKVLAGVTGSGLTNALFMQPGGTLLEITTPLITQSPLMSAKYFEENDIDPTKIALDPNTVQEIHMFYHNLAFFKELSYISIPNMTRSMDNLISFINNDPNLKDFIKHEQVNNI